MSKVIADDLSRDWTQPGETFRIVMCGRMRTVGARIAGQTRVPHPIPPDAPAVVETTMVTLEACDIATQGGFAGNEWVDDDSIGWWGEARQAGQDAAKAVDAMSVCQGEAAIVLTDRRFAVIYPEHMLVSTREAARAGRRKRGLFGRIQGVAAQWLDKHDYWMVKDKVISLWETDAHRVREYGRVITGRGIPFAEVLRVDFVDGSTLFARTAPVDIIQ